MVTYAKYEAIYKTDRKGQVVKFIGPQPNDYETLYLANERFPDNPGTGRPLQGVRVKISILIETASEEELNKLID